MVTTDSNGKVQIGAAWDWDIPGRYVAEISAGTYSSLSIGWQLIERI
jgi:hypothetical protein